MKTVQCLIDECEYCYETFVGGWFACSCPCHDEPDPIIGIWPPIIVIFPPR